MARASRAVWEERVRRWSISGKSAKAFAAEIGVNVNTLTGWRWRLARAGQRAGAAAVQAPGEERAKPREQAGRIAFLELVSSSPEAEDRLEVVLQGGRVVRVPRRFDAEALRALVGALESQ